MVLAIKLSVILFPIGGLMAIPISIWRYRDASFLQFWSDLFRTIAITIDMLGCVILSPVLNAIAITGEGRKFGVAGETISQALAVNYFSGKLTTFGLRLVYFIEMFDPGHAESAYDSWKKGEYE